MTAGARLRELLAGEALVVAPGAYDCLTARIVEHAGFPAVYMTGAGTAASLGYPDYGLLTMSEMAANAARIAAAVAAPVIADADTGFGNELNVVRTVREYAAAGVAAMHIEDQVFPKRCGHLDRKQVIGADAFVSKVRAAAENRPDPELVLIARTDARAVLGFEEAVERANRALEAGADVAFVEAPADPRGAGRSPAARGGSVPAERRRRRQDARHRPGEAAELGYKLAIVPVLLLAAVLAAGDAALAGLAATGRHPDGVPVIGVEELFRRVGAGRWDDVRARYGAD